MSRNRFVELQEKQQDVISLSFIDVLSCAMGSGVFLFLIFSILPHIGLDDVLNPSENSISQSDEVPSPPSMIVIQASVVGIKKDEIKLETIKKYLKLSNSLPKSAVTSFALQNYNDFVCANMTINTLDHNLTTDNLRLIIGGFELSDKYSEPCVSVMVMTQGKQNVQAFLLNKKEKNTNVNINLSSSPKKWITSSSQPLLQCNCNMIQVDQ